MINIAWSQGRLLKRFQEEEGFFGFARIKLIACIFQDATL